MSEPEFWDEYCDEYEDEDPVQLALESGDLPCEVGYCGPKCPYWMGDGLCELVIERQTKEREDYYKNHVKNMKCPVCGKPMKCYEVKADELWVWDASWHDPIIGLEVYSALWVPKGIVHQQGDIYHVWIGTGENRTEKLIRLIKGRSESR